MGAGATPSTYNTTGFQFAEDMSMIRGAHQIGYGVNWIHSELNGVSQLQATAPFTFNGQITRLGLADFMIGRPSSIQQGTTSQGYFRLNYAGFYVQDTWKAASRLTVNAGLRWEPSLPAYSKNGYIVHFDPTALRRVREAPSIPMLRQVSLFLAIPAFPAIPLVTTGGRTLRHAWDWRGIRRATV
jgi:outer membrane receptor protein involved in Fe transport